MAITFICCDIWMSRRLTVGLYIVRVKMSNKQITCQERQSALQGANDCHLYSLLGTRLRLCGFSIQITVSAKYMTSTKDFKMWTV